MYVCTICDYKSEIKEDDEKFDDFNELEKRAIGLIKEANTGEFFKQCGNGYTDWFNRGDGSIGTGIRIVNNQLGAWDFLDISLCHIYYGK